MHAEPFDSLFSSFSLGMKKIIPIAPGVVPFGLIMGSLSAGHGLSLLETMSMNTLVYAGASQLAAIDLMSKQTPAFIVILTGVVINLRFIMYSISLAPLMTNLRPLQKIGLAHVATDQSYAVSINEFDHLKTKNDKIALYLGASLAMTLIWNFSVLSGALFGNFAPSSLSLDFAVPLAFMSLVLPSIKNKPLLIVASTSSVLAVLLQDLPYNLGLIVTAALAMLSGALADSYFSKRRQEKERRRFGTDH